MNRSAHRYANKLIPKLLLKNRFTSGKRLFSPAGRMYSDKVVYRVAPYETWKYKVRKRKR